MNLINNAFLRIADYVQISYVGHESLTTSDIVLSICSDQVHNQIKESWVYPYRNPYEYIQMEKGSKLKMVCKTAKSIEEINEISKKLKEQNNRICGLLIEAHGSPSRIRLSETVYSPDSSPYIYERNVKMLTPTFSRLEQKAQIVLLSCSTGKKEADKTPIAKTIATIANRTVFAPTENANTKGTIVTLEKETISAKFSVQLIKPSSIFSCLLDFFYELIFLCNRIGRDITVVYNPSP